MPKSTPPSAATATATAGKKSLTQIADQANKTQQQQLVGGSQPQQVVVRRRRYQAQIHNSQVLEKMGLTNNNNRQDANKNFYRVGSFHNEKQAQVAVDRICRKFGVEEAKLKYPRNEPLPEIRYFDDECYFCDTVHPLKPVATPCNHVFCESCITLWLQQIGHCPCCQTEFGDEEEIQLRPVTLEPWPGYDEEEHEVIVREPTTVVAAAAALSKTVTASQQQQQTKKVVPLKRGGDEAKPSAATTPSTKRFTPGSRKSARVSSVESKKRLRSHEKKKKAAEAMIVEPPQHLKRKKPAEEEEPSSAAAAKRPKKEEETKEPKKKAAPPPLTLDKSAKAAAPPPKPRAAAAAATVKMAASQPTPIANKKAAVGAKNEKDDEEEQGIYDLSKVSVSDRVALDFEYSSEIGSKDDRTMIQFGTVIECQTKAQDESRWRWKIQFEDDDTKRRDTYTISPADLERALLLDDEFQKAQQASSFASTLSTKIANYKKEFEATRTKTLAGLPISDKLQFRTLGFAQWTKVGYLPCFFVGPYDVSAGPVRDAWFQKFQKSSKTQQQMSRLVFWFGEEDPGLAYSFVGASSTLSYAEGVQKGYDKVSPKTQAKLDALNATKAAPRPESSATVTPPTASDGEKAAEDTKAAAAAAATARAVAKVSSSSAVSNAKEVTPSTTTAAGPSQQPDAAAGVPATATSAKKPAAAKSAAKPQGPPKPLTAHEKFHIRALEAFNEYKKKYFAHNNPGEPVPLPYVKVEEDHERLANGSLLLAEVDVDYRETTGRKLIKKLKSEGKLRGGPKSEKPAAPKAAPAAAKKPPSSSSAAEYGYEGPPDDDLPGGWPKGWIKRTVPRVNSDKKYDPYWFTPKLQKKLRSMREVSRFMDALKTHKGDEEAAFEAIKNR